MRFTMRLSSLLSLLLIFGLFDTSCSTPRRGDDDDDDDAANDDDAADDDDVVSDDDDDDDDDDAGPGVFTCVDIDELSAGLAEQGLGGCTAADQDACSCFGCTDDGNCVDKNGLYDDCVCPDCASDAWCADPANCTDDGLCDPFNEGCVCSDCAEHPSCL